MWPGTTWASAGRFHIGRDDASLGAVLGPGGFGVAHKPRLELLDEMSEAARRALGRAV